MNVITLKDISLPEAAPYAKLTEAQLKTAGFCEGGLFIAESLNVIEAALGAEYGLYSMLTEEKHLESIEKRVGALIGSAPVYTAVPGELERLTGFRLSRGVLAAMKRKPLPSPGEIVTGASRIAVLEGVSDPENIGSIFRSAAALGMDAVLVSSNCCDPLHRRAARVSTGSVFRVPWAVLPCPAAERNCADIERLRGLGFYTAAMALRDDALSIDDARLRSVPRLALVLGAEGNGLAEATIARCDAAVKIPMRHGVDSLNVGCAAAVAFWELRSR
jgi:tRNA G18 (ribose-2'-O)-methylase SpoU